MYILLKHPQLRKLSKEEETELIQNLWTLEEQRFLKRLKEYIVARHTLERP